MPRRTQGDTSYAVVPEFRFPPGNITLGVEYGFTENFSAKWFLKMVNASTGEVQGQDHKGVSMTSTGIILNYSFAFARRK